MQWAAARGHGVAANALLDHGGSMFDGDIEHWAIVLAFVRGHDDLATWMLGGCNEHAQARVRPFVLPHVGDAMREHLIGEIEWRGRVDNDYREYALLAADTELYERLDRHMSPTDRRWAMKGDRGAIEADALAWASPWRHDLGMTAYLLERGRFASQLDLDMWLEHVIEREPSPAAMVLLEAGATPHADAMMDAAFNGQAEIVRALLARGVDPDASERNESTPLAMAIIKGDADVVEALLHGGARPIADEEGASYTKLVFYLRDAARRHPSTATKNPFHARPEDAQRILDLLEAAEARWTDPQQSPTPSGPG